jgi:hypothetical protein
VIESTTDARVKISIVIPTYNRVALLQRSVESALAQDGFQDYEVIVVDDCSSDGSWDSLRRIANPRLKVFRNDSRLGMGPNWNKAVRLSQGEYVFILQDDDVALPNLLKRASELLAESYQIDLLCFATTLIDQDENDRQTFWRPERQEILPPPDALMYFARNWTLSTTQVIFSRVMFEKYGEFDLTPPIMSDAEAILRWMIHGRTLVATDTLALRRYWDGSVTSATISSVAMTETMKFLVQSISERAAASSTVSSSQLRELRESLSRTFLKPSEQVPGRFRGGAYIRQVLSKLLPKSETPG